MSFSSEVKEELENKIDSAKHCQIAELAAIIAMDGKVKRLSGGRFILILTTENDTLISTYMQLLEKAFEIDVESFTIEFEGKKESIRNVILKDEEQVKKILMAIKWCDSKCEKITPAFVHKLLVQKECCKRAFIKGAFMAAGSISDPNKFYHFEIVCDYEEDAQELRDMMKFFDLDAKIIQRKNSFVVYLKEGNNITDILNLCGAYVSQMNLYNIMILKGVRNDLNRKVNCETANMNKTVSAAVKQIRDIEYIRDEVGLDYLETGLRQVAEIRLENVDMSLKDIGEMLTPAVGKSGVNHRFRKIGDIAEKLRISRQ